MQKISFELELFNFHIDFLGHVNNAVYVQWMDIRRSKLLEAIRMPVYTIFQQEIVPILDETNITYKSPLYLGYRVRIKMWLSELKNASVIMQFCFYNDQGTLAAEAWQKVLFVDKQTTRPRRFSPEERSLFTPYVDSTVDAQPVNLLLSVP